MAFLQMVESMIYVFLLLVEGVSYLCLNGLAISTDYILNMNLNINEINKGGIEWG